MKNGMQVKLLLKWQASISTKRRLKKNTIGVKLISNEKSVFLWKTWAAPYCLNSVKSQKILAPSVSIVRKDYYTCGIIQFWLQFRFYIKTKC